MAYCLNLDCPQPQNSRTARFCEACGTPLCVRGSLNVGCYRLISLLGQGGFGRTFLSETVSPSNAEQKSTSVAVSAESVAGSVVSSATALPLGTRCVVKQFFPSQVYENSLVREQALANKTPNQTSGDRSSFQVEAGRLRQLGSHPQIPRLFDAFENELGQFLVQEFAPGDNLQQQVETHGLWDGAAVRSLLESLVSVLQYVHSFQIIHRDIKPANIVSPPLQKNAAGRSLAPVLVDFGSARWIKQTPAQTVIGSAGYASPEQSMGQATFASDIYSLGLTCLYLLTGVHPFELYSAVEERWVWQDYLPSPVDPQLAQVLEGMVARSLQVRYESMAQVELALKAGTAPSRQLPGQLFKKAKEKLKEKARETAKTSLPGLSGLLNPSGQLGLPKLSSNAIKRTLSKPRQKRALKPSERVTHVTQSWQRLHKLSPNIGLTQALAVSPDGQRFISAGSDGAIRLWSLPGAQLLHTFSRRRLVGNGHRGAIAALAFHPDGRAFYSASVDGTIKEWDSAEFRLLNTLPTSGWATTDVLVTPDGTQLISANRDGKMTVWEIASLLPTAQLSQHQSCVNAIAAGQSPAHLSNLPYSLLASASDDGTVKLWTPRIAPESGPTAQLSKTIRLPSEDGRAIAVALHVSSPYGQQLIIFTEHVVTRYDLDAALTISDVEIVHQSKAVITAIALNKNGLLALGSENRVLTLWQIDTGACVAQLAHDWGISAISFTPDGKTLVSASADEVISIWRRTD